MKSKKTKQLPQNILHPRENQNFFGHGEAVSTLYSSFTGNKISGSWLFSGPRGIGKATLAYRLARFIFYNSVANKDGLFSTPHPITDLSIPKTSASFMKVTAGSHPDLLVLEAGSEDSSSTSGDILVDDARKIANFLHLTSSETPYRVVIIDSIDDMNSNAANSILKLLEEPPAHSVFILISHAPGRLLPTIRSRCRQIKMREMPINETLRVLQNISPDIAGDTGNSLMNLESGSPGLAYDIHVNNGIAIYTKIAEILLSLPILDVVAIQKLGESVSGKQNDNYWRITKVLLDKIIINLTKYAATDNKESAIYSEKNMGHLKLSVAIKAERLVEIWKESNNLLAECDNLHLDRKAILMKIFLLISGK